MIPKIKYLNNKELLIEIHKSKVSYCEFDQPKYADYDVIVSDLKKVTQKMLKAIKAKKAEDISIQKRKELIALGQKNPTVVVKPSQIETTDIVVRLMTYDHIPLNPAKLDKAKTEGERHIRCNFPPFQHFVLDKNNKWKCVGKSHWKNGKFSLSHGKTTSRLAMMYMKLVDRYGSRGNWRGYCEAADAQALTKRGWLNYDEINNQDMILSYDQGQLKWSKIKSIYRSEYQGKMHKLQAGNIDSLVTPGHKFITDRGLIPIEYICSSDTLTLMGTKVNDVIEKTHDDDFVKLIGWIIVSNGYKNPKQCLIKNKKLDPAKIKACLEKLNCEFLQTSSWCFELSNSYSDKIKSLFENKQKIMSFVLSLTHDQKQLLIDTVLENKPKKLVHGDLEIVDMFQALCALMGYGTKHTKTKSANKSLSYQTNQVLLVSENKKTIKAKSIDFHGGMANANHIKQTNKVLYPNIPMVNYQGMVWCPETEYGCFLARRDGIVYLTGNTYLDEMKSQALLQLSQIGLQFDESRSQNPFSYYTATITNSFTRILNLEKRNQNIRDDMLIMHGASPSYTRQAENDMSQSGGDKSE